jgi:hypothetical protein
MLKPCPECRTMMNAEAPYCDSCGCAFTPVELPRDLKVFVGVLAMLSVVIVAVAFLRSFIG